MVNGQWSMVNGQPAFAKASADEARLLFLKRIWQAKAMQHYFSHQVLVFRSSGPPIAATAAS